MGWTSLLALLAGFALGAIPFGLLLLRAMGRGDIRRLGSGNIGATNALRVGGPVVGAATLLLDVGKGAGAVLLGEMLAPGGGLTAGAGAFIGHLFSPWLAWKGGKGVATMLGVAIGVLPAAGAVFALAWLVVAAATRFSSLAGMVAAIAAPASALLLGREPEALLLSAMAGLLVGRHRANIARLRAGTEPPIGAIKARR